MRTPKHSDTTSSIFKKETITVERTLLETSHNPRSSDPFDIYLQNPGNDRLTVSIIHTSLNLLTDKKSSRQRLKKQ